MASWMWASVSPWGSKTSASPREVMRKTFGATTTQASQPVHSFWSTKERRLVFLVGDKERFPWVVRPV